MATWWASAQRWRPSTVLVDVGIVASVAVVVFTAITVARESNSSPLDALAYAFGAVIALLTLGRRRWPLAVLLASSAVLLTYFALQYPGISPALVLAVSLYTAAVAGRTGWSLAVVSVFLVTGVSVRWVAERESLLPLLIDTTQDISIMVVVLLLGATVRSRRLRDAATTRAQAAAAAEQELDAARRVAEERLRIARELHDVLAHTIATVTVQAGVAIDVLDDSPADARTALREIRTATRTAMQELGATVGVLRDRDGAAAPAPTLDQLDGLLSTARSSGLWVGLERTGDARRLSAAIELNAYRIVQESLTNVVRHSGATSAAVAMHYRSDALVVEITDDGPGSARGARARAPGGHGIDGMRERAAALGGSLQAGPRAGGGYAVTATLPVDRRLL